MLIYLSTVPLCMGLSSPKQNAESELSRRIFGQNMANIFLSGSASLALIPQQSNAQVFFDPAMYGDQELRVGAVDSLKESVRRAILKKPELAPSFYTLSLLDGLSYDAQSQKYGPDGSIVKVVLSSKETDQYTRNLQEASLALIEAEKGLRKKVAITIADAVAIGGAEAIESIGGPVLPVQLGRADAPLKQEVSPVPYTLLSGARPHQEVTKYFKQAGLTEREMTALLSGLLTLDRVEKTRSTEDWKASARPKFREPGKIGRVSEFKPLTDEDIAQAELDDELEDPDDGWYIADSFGTRDDRFGNRIAKEDINEKSFNKYLKEVNEAIRQKDKALLSTYGWVADLFIDDDSPTVQTWVNKYASSNLNYLKDLSLSFNSITQLGAVYTGGKYENLLKSKPRKSLNDDDLKLF